MTNVSKKNSPQDLVGLILQANPGASLEMIADIISEWGDEFDDRKFGDYTPIDIDRVSPKNQRQMHI